MRPIAVEEGQPVIVKFGRKVSESCCDCGLTHTKLYERSAGGELVIRAWRDVAATRTLRSRTAQAEQAKRKR